MASRLRIARLDPLPYKPVGVTAAPTAADHRRLVALIRAHLPAVMASLFAQPETTADASAVEWYSDLAGQPTPLTDLPPAERRRVQALLADRVHALGELAERLRQSGPDGEAQATQLRAALRYPGDAAVFAVGGQPVLTFWGHQRADEPTAALEALPPSPVAPSPGRSAIPTEPTDIPPPSVGGPPPVGGAPPPDVAVAPGPMRRRWPWLLFALLLLAAGGLAADRWLGWGPLLCGPDVAAQLRTAVAEGDILAARVAELEARLRHEVQLCSAGDELTAAQEEGKQLAAAIAALERRLADQLATCPLREELAQAANESDALGEKLAARERELAAALRTCQPSPKPTRPPAPTRPHAPTPPPSAPTAEVANAQGAEPTRPPCPGQRAPEQAPDVAIVLDASGSMRLPASMAAAGIQDELRRLGGIVGVLGSIVLEQSGGPSRLDQAKTGVNSVVRSLPDDVDVGVTVLQNCPRADNLGFFPANRRGELYGRVAQLQPMRGTPLAEGLEEAANMVDGVSAPAIIVVVSDGDDSCQGDPCATARALKARKPQLTINVVDIIGNGAGSCMARATGGKMLTPHDGLAFEKSIREAAEDALKPAYCP